jgi:hypothetical protein
MITDMELRDEVKTLGGERSNFKLNANSLSGPAGEQGEREDRASQI